ncbi:molybdopterin-dependent oxidoreductase [Sedimentibacter sp. MB31-C6]|uniref:molybdopterin-dependent oxidoreductase n=1 Tax=Sedimentibacter sp. MB31-C6 TaxID=3109366 RepID=UPI002DDD246B|nr:molybdopterin-dependent oxidoreductase [Sedimentibacter sp. MB36-C1]WSI02921.1 molybdopterin-dependent oxidoreductase [Sedimentibacter sp. MB36-C1]
MKRILIILMALLLLLAGCSTSVNENSDIDNNEKIESATLKPDEKTTEGEIESEEDNNIEQITEEPTTEELITEEPITEEPSSVEQTNNIDDEKNTKNLLKIEGLVENELSLSLDELKAMTDIIFEADFYSLNSFGTTGYTYFKGIKLWNLLDEVALIKPDATKISIIAEDGYKMEFTIEQVQNEYIDETNPENKYPMIIAWEEDGEEYNTDEGAPYKLVVGQKEAGDVNKPQWVSNIDVILIE